MSTLNDSLDVPHEFQKMLDLLSMAPKTVWEIFRYALVLLLINDEKAWVVESHVDGDTLHIIVETVEGKRFDVVKPYLSAKVETILFKWI